MKYLITTCKATMLVATLLVTFSTTVLANENQKPKEPIFDPEKVTCKILPQCKDI